MQKDKEFLKTKRNRNQKKKRFEFPKYSTADAILIAEYFKKDLKED